MSLLLAPLLAAGIALAEPASCPLTLDAGAVRVAQYPRGWEPVPTQGMRLTNGGLIRGAPAEWGYLRPLRTTQSKGGNSSVNEFSRGEEKWLWCGYGGADVQIAQRLPDAATVCTVTSRKADGAVTEIRADCR